MNKKVINFDMDGTIADLYGVANWLDYLIAEDATPYAVAKPLVNMQVLARLLNKLQKNGYTINIISWTSKNGSDAYNSLVADVKKAWLKKHLKSVKFNNIFVVPYGTPKNTIASGILFDDEEKNRATWGKNAYDVDNILGVLKAIA
jgi:5'(3')-deoxyribonucleotidase